MYYRNIVYTTNVCLGQFLPICPFFLGNQNTLRIIHIPIGLSIYYSNEFCRRIFKVFFLHITFILYVYTVSKSSSLSFITMSKDHFSHNPFIALCYVLLCIIPSQSNCFSGSCCFVLHTINEKMHIYICEMIFAFTLCSK